MGGLAHARILGVETGEVYNIYQLLIIDRIVGCIGCRPCVDLTASRRCPLCRAISEQRFELKGFSSLLSIFHSMESKESEEFLFEQQAGCEACFKAATEDDLRCPPSQTAYSRYLFP